MSTTKTANYSEAQIKKMQEAAPLDQSKCKTLASEFGKTSRSVIAKAKSEGIDYIVKAKPAAKKPATTKAEVVSDIATMLGCDELEPLVKASMAVLVSLRDNVRAKLEC